MLSSLSTKLSAEEAAELDKSTSKLKDLPPSVPQDSGSMEVDPFGSKDRSSYREKLTGKIPGAYEKVFYQERIMMDDTDDDVEETQEKSTRLKFSLSREDKIRIRSKYSTSLIIKLVGRSVQYQYLVQRLKIMWKPTGDMTCILLGEGFYLVKFNMSEDMDRVLREGPWFINGQFLSIRLWEPKFNPEKANVSVVALWVRLPKLPMEFYDVKILEGVGNKIGPLLRIDNYTLNAERGLYARLCVQVDMSKPLPSLIDIGDYTQRISYEGINSLCFKCGLAGHTDANCVNSFAPTPISSEQSKDTTTTTVVTGGANTGRPLSAREEVVDDQERGPWMIVTHRKRRTPANLRGQEPVTASASTGKNLSASVTASPRTIVSASASTGKNLDAAAGCGHQEKQPAGNQDKIPSGKHPAGQHSQSVKGEKSFYLKPGFLRSNGPSLGRINKQTIGPNHTNGTKTNSISFLSPPTNIHSSSSTVGDGDRVIHQATASSSAMSTVQASPRIDIGFKFPTLKRLGNASSTSNHDATTEPAISKMGDGDRVIQHSTAISSAMSTVRPSPSSDISGNPTKPTSTNSGQAHSPVRERSRSPTRLGMSRDRTIVT